MNQYADLLQAQKQMRQAVQIMDSVDEVVFEDNPIEQALEVLSVLTQGMK